MSFVAIAATFAISAAGTGLVRRYALSTKLLDVPNQRSSHQVATPRGGGVAIVVASAVGWLLSDVASAGFVAIAWAVGAALIVVTGYVDDRRGLSARLRIFVHAIAAFAVVSQVQLQPIPYWGGAISLGLVGQALSLVAIVWCVNSFNFMDGTDGIASGEAAFVLGCAALLMGLQGAGRIEVSVLAVCAAAAVGFLLWNWPPARIFMGDTGSGFLGFVIGAAAVTTSGYHGVSVWTWATLYAVFVADATTTLVVRALRGARLHEAHRSHAYQILARRWSSHRRVLIIVAAIDVIWLMPLAALTVASPARGPFIAAIALAPLIVGCVVVGAGSNAAE